MREIEDERINRKDQEKRKNGFARTRTRDDSFTMNTGPRPDCVAPGAPEAEKHPQGE